MYVTPPIPPDKLATYFIYDPRTNTLTRNWVKRSQYVKSIGLDVHEIHGKCYTTEQIIHYLTHDTPPPDASHPDNPTKSVNMTGATIKRINK